jgi:hypothetical protein
MKRAVALMCLSLSFAIAATAQAQAQYGGPYYSFGPPSYQNFSPYFPPSYPNYDSGYPRYYSGAQMHRFDGGLYGTYGGYQPLGISSGRGYANPPYMYSSPGAAPLLSMDGGTYSLGAQRRLRSLTRPSRGEIKIVHKKDASSEVHYSLNGVEFTIKPGEEQVFADDRNWVIAIQDQTDAKPHRYTLKTGNYQFVASEKGWNLKQIVPKKTPPASADSVSPM